MKFYDLDALENKCGTDNKYEITALVAARARWLSEHKTVEEDLPVNEKYLMMLISYFLYSFSRTFSVPFTSSLGFVGYIVV